MADSEGRGRDRASPRRAVSPRRSLLLLGLALSGCGSTPASELPPPAGPAHSPPASERPVGRILGPHEEIGWFAYAGPTPHVDRARDRVTLGRRSAPTCREPVDATMYDSDRVVAVLCGRERVVQLFAAGGLRRIGSAPAGTGPARIASDG